MGRPALPKMVAAAAAGGAGAAEGAAGTGQRGRGRARSGERARARELPAAPGRLVAAPQPPPALRRLPRCWGQGRAEAPGGGGRLRGRASGTGRDGADPWFLSTRKSRHCTRPPGRSRGEGSRVGVGVGAGGDGRALTSQAGATVVLASKGDTV